MADRPLVSVIMNCYNGEKYLAQAIDSVLAQTYNNWEIIFWDNQSTDTSADIFKSYSDPRLKYYYAPMHTLLYEARNYAIEKASGEFYAFLDVDDWWAPNKLELQLLEFADPEVGMVCSNYWVESAAKKKRWLALRQSIPTGWVLDDVLKHYYVALVTLMVRRSAFESFNPRYHIIGDFDLVIRIAASWKLAAVQTPIAYYRTHADSETHKQPTRQINELTQWLQEMRAHPRIGRSPHLESVHYYTNYIAGIGRLLARDRPGAWRLAAALPFGRYKFRLLAASLLPHTLLKSLKN
jgi:glycosyltransferase involved in cell wall biosynthesis